MCKTSVEEEEEDGMVTLIDIIQNGKSKGH